LNISINKVKYVPKLCANLFSINKAINDGFSLSNKGTSISLTKGSSSIIFDRVINTMSGTISRIKMIGNESPVAHINSVNANNINKFHEMIGHCGPDRLKRTATVHGLKLKGDLKVCEDCAEAKRRGRKTLIKTGRKEVKHLVKEFI
jgi:hypothetical protein